MEQGVMVRGISSAEASKFETLFRLLDSEGTGTINEKELADLMPRMGVFLSESELHLLFQSVDIDGSGGIDFPEFLQLMSRHREANQLTLLEGGRTVFKELQTASKTKFVLRPDDPVNWACDLIVMGAVVFYIGMVIYEDVKQADILQAVPMKVFWAAVMALDLFRGAVTSHPPEDSDTLPVDNLNFAMKGYLHSNKFLLDFIAAFPLDCIFMATGQPRPMRAAQHLRLMKAFCVRHLFKLSARDILSPAYTRFHFSIVPLIRIVFWAMIVVHLLSVTWILISPGLDVPYIEAVYFVVYTLTTTGYGDITVETDIQRCFAVFLFCCASVVTGLVVGKLVQFSQQADLQTDSDKRMLETLAALNHLTIPQDFKEEVLAFQLHRLKHSNSLFNDAVSGLPQVMQDRMALYARMKIVRQVPIFSKAPEICVAKLAQSLINVVVPPEEYIVIAGEEGEEMFFLFHGMCGVWLPVSGSGKWIATIKRGGVFGEVALLEETRRSASIKSLTYCQLFRLDKAAFLNIVDNFPALLESIQSVSVASRKKPSMASKDTIGATKSINTEDQIRRKKTLHMTLCGAQSGDLFHRDSVSVSDTDDTESVVTDGCSEERTSACSSTVSPRKKLSSKGVFASGSSFLESVASSESPLPRRTSRLASKTSHKSFRRSHEDDLPMTLLSTLFRNVDLLLDSMENVSPRAKRLKSMRVSSPTMSPKNRIPRSFNSTLHTLSKAKQLPKPTGAWTT